MCSVSMDVSSTSLRTDAINRNLKPCGMLYSLFFFLPKVQNLASCWLLFGLGDSLVGLVAAITAS